MREAAGAIFNTDPVMQVDAQLVEMLKERALAAHQRHARGHRSRSIEESASKDNRWQADLPVLP